MRKTFEEEYIPLNDNQQGKGEKPGQTFQGRIYPSKRGIQMNREIYDLLETYTIGKNEGKTKTLGIEHRE